MPMRTNLLKQILAVPTCSRQEGRMVEFLLNHVRQRGPKRCGRSWADRWNNVFIRKGEIEPVPLVCAHLDTVYNWTEVEIVEQDGLPLVLTGAASGAGLARTINAELLSAWSLSKGVTVLRSRYSRKKKSVRGRSTRQRRVLCGHRLRGGVRLSDHRAGRYSAGGQRLFQNDGGFIQIALPVLTRFGFTSFQHHPFKDVTGLRKRFPFSCLNVSCGYHHWHTDNEHVNITEVEISLAMATELIAALGNRQYDYDASKPDTAAPPMEVTELRLPVTHDRASNILCTENRADRLFACQ